MQSTLRQFFLTLGKDVRYAVRQLRKSPGFTLVTVLTLALGIGAAAAMFTIVDGVLLRPLVFPHASQLYAPVAIGAKGDRSDWISYADIQQWQSATHNSAQIAFSGGDIVIAGSNSGAQLISNDTISANLLQTLGVQPVLGRGFLPQEQEDGQSHVALLSYAVWQQVFAGSRQVLGQTVRIGGTPYAVIGVMPPHFAMPRQGNLPQVFTPIDRSTLLQADAKFMPILRLKPGVTSATVQAELSSVQAHIAQTAKPGYMVATHVQLTGLRDSMVANVRPALTALEIAVGLVWLIACSNVAGLLLARVASRRVEIAVRGALGAGRLRIIRQFLTESLLLSATGAVAGLCLAMLALEIFRRMLEKNLPLSQNIHMNPIVLGSLIGFTLLTGFFLGSIPAIIAARSPIEETLKSGVPTSSRDRGQARLRNALLIGEIALSMVLLVAAGLMLRTVYALHRVPLGFRTDHIVLTSFNVPNYDYKGRDLNTALWNPLLERVQHLLGVQSAALSTVLPIGHTMELQMTLYALDWAKGDVAAAVRAASPDLTHVLGMRMQAGRFFTAQDTQNAPLVIVVNQAFVRHYLSGQNVLGKQIRLGNFLDKTTIVGVLEDVHQDGVESPSQPEIYLGMAQLPPGKSLSRVLIGQVMELAVRTQTAPDAMIPELRRVIHQANPNLVAGDFTTMKQAVEDSIGSQRLAAQVIGVFGGLALLITVVGLYGLLSYSVAQRTREIGIRMAVGADRGHVMRMVLRQAMVLLIAGIAAGLALAFWSSRLLHSFLYGVSKHDPWTLAAVPLLLLLCGVVAAFVPARRAASVDPIHALHSE
ncbi:MAG TPA: ABC transporter permease [Acidobacteriaceae bacterium]|jgi:predicted permease|nr:ABC transporter permease [Acidobacteriaceae bacterium]